MTTEPNETETMTDSQKEDEKKVRKWDFVNKHWAATIIFSGVVLLLVAFLFIKREIFTGLLAYVFDVLRPITIGLVIAFVLYRPTCQIDKLFRKVQQKFPRFPAGAMAVFCAYFLMLALLSIVIWIIVPQFITSIRDFGDNIMVYYNNIMKFLNSDRGEQILKLLQDNDINPAMLRTKLMSLTTYIPDAVGTLSTWASGLIGGVIDFFIGLIFSVYVLAGRNKLRRQAKLIFRHFLPKKHYEQVVHYGRLAFPRSLIFVSGQLSQCVHSGRADFLCHEYQRTGIPHDDRGYHRHHQHDPLCGTVDGYYSLCVDPADGQAQSCHCICHYRYHCPADRQQPDLPPCGWHFCRTAGNLGAVRHHCGRRLVQRTGHDRRRSDHVYHLHRDSGKDHRQHRFTGESVHAQTAAVAYPKICAVPPQPRFQKGNGSRKGHLKRIRTCLHAKMPPVPLLGMGGICLS